MAGYREHIGVSGLLGAAYGAAATWAAGFTPVQGALAGGLTWVSGMFPDLDAQSGRPVRELFGLLAAILPMLLMRRLLAWSQSVESSVAIAFAIYGVIRFGGPVVLGWFSVHRGMFHSIPALVIAAECAFLAYQSDDAGVRFLMAGGVALGFLSHLVLDEVYSVQWSGLRLKLNKAAGSALKLFGKNVMPNIFCYGLLVVLTYATLADIGLIEREHPPGAAPFLRQAAEETPARN
ncbi:MAG: metal-dependent hydrolase [Planctomycetaceae bacterium]